MDKGGPLTLTNSVVRNSYTTGLRIEGAAPTLTNNTWTNSFGPAVSMDLAASPAISGVTFANNGINGVSVDGGSLPADNAWDDPDIVYWVSSNITVPAGKTLTVSPGQIVKVPFGDRNFIVNGTLRATGTAVNPVVFTSGSDDSAGGDTNNNGPSSGGHGEWAAIQFNAGSTNNLLDHVEVRFGGGWSYRCRDGQRWAADVDQQRGAKLLYDRSTDRSAAPTLTNNTWTNSFGPALSMDLAASPAISGVTFANNGINGVSVDGGSLPADNAWDDPDIVYWVSSNITVPAGKTLTVSPGQIVKVPFGDRSLLVNGTLRATGTAVNPVVFTAGSDDSAGGDTNNNGPSSGGHGEWAAIRFNAGSTNNLLSRTEVRMREVGHQVAR